MHATALGRGMHITQKMQFSENELYHIYNRGNNQQKIFFTDENYLFFIKKIRSYILPFCDILAFCLMPNHFHLLINANNKTIATKNVGGKEKNVLSEGFRNLLSSYTLAINKQNNSSGSLFQQNTKAKSIARNKNLYDLLCFHYIHQNPIKTALTKKMEDWEFSSFKDYCGFRNGTLCNKKLAVDLLGLNMKIFYEESYRIINNDEIKNIF